MPLLCVHSSPLIQLCSLHRYVRKGLVSEQEEFRWLPHFSSFLDCPLILQAAERFAKKLQSGHRQGCPWIGNACDENLASYPPLPQAQVLTGFNARLSDLEHLSHLPAISASAVSKISATHRCADILCSVDIVHTVACIQNCSITGRWGMEGPLKDLENEMGLRSQVGSIATH